MTTVLQKQNLLSRKPETAFVFFWFVLNVLQISFTELTSDEGYYWFYSQRLQWGYYDHPPLVAVLIKLGTAILPGEAGVRFFSVLFSTAGLWLFLTLLPLAWRSKQSTYLILLSAPLLHYLCFIVFPDGPLLFFSLLFLIVYKRFLQRATLPIAMLLGLCMALMAWSKYHGVLVVLFTVVANPKLFRTPLFYLSILVAAVLFAPHLWWQYQNDFPTFRYHLSGRTGSWSFKHIGEYLSQQVVAIGPGLIFVLFVSKARDVFERTLKVIIIGTLAFFLLSSAKTFVHFHWTSIALFPLLYFAVGYYNQAPQRKVFYWLIVPFAVLMIGLRFLLAVPVISAMHAGSDYYHGRKQWAKDIAAVAGNRPVFIPNNLREASLYSFYTGKQGVTLYTRPEKKTQYELWGYEDSLQGKEVFVITKYPFEGSQPLPNALNRQIFAASVNDFESYYNGVTINAKPDRLTTDSAIVEIEMINNRPSLLTFRQAPTLICFIRMKGAEPTVKNLQSLSGAVLTSGISRITAAIQLKDLPPGEYEIEFGIRTGVLPEAVLSAPLRFRRN